MKSEYDFSRGKRGPVIPVPKGKTRITIRLDKDLLDWFRAQVEAAGGGNYQTLINVALREYVRQASSQIAEDVAPYGRSSGVEMRNSGRGRQKKRHDVISIPIEAHLLERSDQLARTLGLNRSRLIERGLKAVLAAQGKL
jgi:metal-responsive CopG/Arc/MetJ family transcriptional regulator